MTTFLDDLAEVDRRVDARLSELVEITPQSVTGVAPAAPDPDRIPFEVPAVVVTAHGRDVDAGGARRNFHATVRGGGIIASVRTSLLDGRLVREGDSIALVQRDGAPRYRIARIDRDDLGRTEFVLERSA
jgi:hypothetical protein